MTDSYYFRSIGPSACIDAVRRELAQVANPRLWNIGGGNSILAVFLPTTNAVEDKLGPGLKTQIWMERPKDGRGRCKFEVAYKVPGFDAATNEKLRETIATSIRSCMSELGLPGGVEFATRSTVAAVRMSLPRIKQPSDDTETNARYYSEELAKVRVFAQFMEKALLRWKDSRLPGLSLRSH